MSFRFRALAAGLGSVLAACTPKASAPPRPSTVPPSAIWAGGVDGGAWFECEVAASGQSNRCTIYNDYTGAVWMQGQFALRVEKRGATKEELAYEAFDGIRIHLRGGKVLDPIDGK